jgi:hypothetical protein
MQLLHTIQNNVYERPLLDKVFEANDGYQNAGKKKAPSRTRQAALIDTGTSYI